MSIKAAKLGDIVLYRQQIDDRGRSKFVDWPAIVHKMPPNDKSSYRGLIVFMEDAPTRFASVDYSAEPAAGRWSFLDWGERDGKMSSVQW